MKKDKSKPRTILAVVGLPGAGKTTAVKYLSKKKLSAIRFGKIVDDYIDERKLQHDKETHRKIWTGLRQQYGNEAFAILNEKKIVEALKRKSVLIDGLRSWEEFLYLKKRFPSVKIYLVAVYADKNTRYQRSAKRRYRPNLFGEDRDVNELIGMNMGPTIAFADFFVENNFSMGGLHQKLEKIYNNITNDST